MDKQTALIDCKDAANSATACMQGNLEGDTHTVNGPSSGNNGNPQRKYIEDLKSLIESIPGPNDGRIQELRDQIRKGTLITKEAVREAAEKLARQFLGR